MIINPISKKIPVPVLVFSVLYLLVIISSINIPMFWDMSYIARISNLIYDNHFSSIIFNTWDNGTPPLYSIYLAVLWTVFGKSLLISHFAILPFSVGIVYNFYKISVRYIGKNYIYLSLLLLLIEPTILTQTLLGGYDIAICFFFLFGLNSILENKRSRIALALLFIPLMNARGFAILFSVFLIDIFINHLSYKTIKGSIRNIAAYIPAILIFIIWLFYHYYETGWFYVSEKHSRVFIKTISFESVARNLIYILWKIIDFGRIGLFVIVPWLFVKYRKENNFKMLLFFLFSSIISYVVFFIPFSIPISHRYFMISYIIGILIFVYFINSLKKKYLQILLSSVIVIVLFTGNLWLYKERYGNGWDSSLKVLPYFSLKKQFDNFLVSSNIEPMIIGSKFPLDFDNYDCNLNDRNFSFVDLDKKAFRDIQYVVQSNISNTFTPEEIETLNSKWKLIKELRAWPVYIKLFKNPNK